MQLNLIAHRYGVDMVIDPAGVSEHLPNDAVHCAFASAYRVIAVHGGGRDLADRIVVGKGDAGVPGLIAVGEDLRGNHLDGLGKGVRVQQVSHHGADDVLAMPREQRRGAVLRQVVRV